MAILAKPVREHGVREHGARMLSVCAQPLRALLRACVPALCCLGWTCPAPSATTYYLATNGDDSGPGTLAAPWASFEHAFGRLGPGDVLLVRGGIYYERDLDVALAGTASAPIRIEAYPGEQPVLDGGLPEFRTKGNGDWELYDASKGVYRSKQVFPGAGSVGSFFGAANQGWRLVPYEDRGTLSTNQEDYAAAWPWYYVGPGALWDPSDRRIYVRLAPGKYQGVLGTNVPGVSDPADVKLFFFPQGELLEFQPGTAHVELRGIDLYYGEVGIEVGPGVHHLTIADAELRCGRYAVIVRDQAADLLFERVEFQGGFPDYVARSDVKEPNPGRPAHLLQGAGLYVDDRCSGVELRECRFEELFDAIDAPGRPQGLRILGCEFRTIRDEVVQLSSAGYDFEFAHNLCERVTAGVSWDGNGAPPAAWRGTKYVHHNVIDSSTSMLYGRSDPKGLLPQKWQGPNGDGMATGRAFGMHNEPLITAPDPWKIYHNTIVVAQDVDGRGAGQCYYIGPYDAANPHEVFNNVFVQTAPHRIAREARVHDGSQVFDGNLYWRSVSGQGAPLFLDFKNGSQQQDFSSLNAFLLSAYALKTQSKYAPGWEASGVQADPLLNHRYVPDPNGPAASGAVDLSQQPWPGLAGEAFRGALDPGANLAPAVDAGPDQDIKLAALARLYGSCTDDGLPSPPGKLACTWSQKSGPGPVAFADPSDPATTASFTATGRYVLQLTADDGALKTKDFVVVDVD